MGGKTYSKTIALESNSTTLNGPANFVVYPNPASTQLTIEGVEGAVVENIELLDVQGRSLPVEGFGEADNFALDLTTVNLGIYIY